MPASNPDQLTLLAVSPSPKGPARPPVPRSARAVARASLPLPFEPPREHTREEILAGRLRPVPRPVPPPAPAPRETDLDPVPETPVETAGCEPAEAEPAVFLVREGAARRRELLRALTERIALAVLRQDGVVEGRDGAGWSRGRLERRALHVTFADLAARARWLPAWQAAARELGLVEPD